MPLRELFQMPDPPVDLLRKVKEYARHCARDPLRGTMSPEVAAVAYSASIAVASERLGTRITKSTDEVLRQSLGVVAAYSWVPDEIRDVIESCRRSLPRQEDPEFFSHE